MNKEYELDFKKSNLGATMTKLVNILFCFLLAFASAQLDASSCGYSVCQEIDSNSCGRSRSSSFLRDFNIYNVYSVGRNFGNSKNYGSAGIFYAPCISPCCFGGVYDVSYQYYDDGSFGVSAGVGIRGVNACDTLVGGLHIYYDYREGKAANYNQVGLSLEVIGNCFEIRANGYIPLGDRERTGSKRVFSDYDNTGVETPYIVRAYQKEYAYGGADLEGGLKYDCGGFLAYGGVGSYFFENHSLHHRLWGAIAKVRLELGRIVMLQGQYTWDKILKSDGRVWFEINLPLNFLCDFCSTAFCSCKSQARVLRDAPIHLRRCCHYRTNF